MQFAIIETPAGRFATHRVALFNSVFDAINFYVDSPNHNDLDIVELNDEGQSLLDSIDHVVIG